VGFRLNAAREFSDSTELLATMLVVLIIGMVVDQAFTFVDREVRKRRGLAN
jgi:NitT/TauT family transport system permease protein